MRYTQLVSALLNAYSDPREMKGITTSVLIIWLVLRFFHAVARRVAIAQETQLYVWQETRAHTWSVFVN